MNENRNLVLSIILSIIILVGFEFYSSWRYPDSNIQKQASSTNTNTKKATQDSLPRPSTSLTNTPTAQSIKSPSKIQIVPKDRQTLLKENARVLIQSPNLNGSLSLLGGRIDDLTLTNYYEELDKTSPPIVLLSPSGGNNAYFADFGWVGEGATLPNENTIWTASSKSLSPGKPVTLKWDNGQGLIFKRTATQ